MVDVFCKDAAPARLGAALANDRLYPDATRLATFLDSHDLPRIRSACGAAREDEALTFLLTARGTPVLQWGTESGLEGAVEPANRADMRFGADPALAARIAKLLAMRRDHAPVFATGASRILAADGRHFVYARVARDEAAIVAVNHAAVPLPLSLPPDLAAATIRDALTGEPAEAIVPAGATRVFLLAGKFEIPTLVTRAVEVRVAAPATAPGDSLLLVGSAPELGSWDPASGMPMTVTGSDAIATVRLAAPAVYEYKLVVRAADGRLRWESGDNRILFVDAGGAAPPTVTARER
jgi:hypothetical protein